MEPAAILPAIGTVTAAFIAAFVAFLTAVYSKEQKISEFRYAWLNAVLDDVARFAGRAESMIAALRSHIKTQGTEKTQAFFASAEPQIGELLTAYYRARIRLYPERQHHQHVLQALERLQVLILKGDAGAAGNVDQLLHDVVRVSHDALRAEWTTIQAGETTFRVTKYISAAVALIALILLIGFALTLGQ